jgi:ATP-dependent DNA helicase RecG
VRLSGFEELFELQLGSLLAKAELEQEKAKPIAFDEATAVEFTKHLGFKLTDDQRKVIWQIYKDISNDSPMNRLIEGDVGSGKTVVAAMAAVMTMLAGHQVLYMAPTEILARQQAETLSQVFAHTIWKDQIGLLVGSLKTAQKTALHKRIADGSCRLVVGTHALIQDAVATDNVALVVIDEQHRFGVDQRQKLRSKAGLFPHVLCMTATPIPRSLALTLYGELDLSIIKDKPPGRKPTETKVVPFQARSALYQDVDIEISRGRQVFVVCPLINESDSLQVQAVESLFKELQTKLLKNRRVGIVHGSMKAADKEAVMKDFSAGKLDVLVATTVIEVGVNVPNATVMIIEGAERFGLAQIHQLRGRVGRAEHQSYCYLVPSLDIGMTKRLRAVESTNDGFRLAELDLELRGPGAIYGSRQSGLLDLKMASLNDRVQVARAKEFAHKFISSGENLLKYPQLNRRIANFRSLQKLN